MLNEILDNVDESQLQQLAVDVADKRRIWSENEAESASSGNVPTPHLERARRLRATLSLLTLLAVLASMGIWWFTLGRPGSVTDADLVFRRNPELVPAHVAAQLPAALRSRMAARLTAPDAPFTTPHERMWDNEAHLGSEDPQRDAPINARPVVCSRRPGTVRLEWDRSETDVGYLVSVTLIEIDEEVYVTSQNAPLKQPEVVVNLDAGFAYRWALEVLNKDGSRTKYPAEGQPRFVFITLTEAEAERVAALEKEAQGMPLALAVIYAEFRMYDDARAELDKLRQNPKLSRTARDKVDAMAEALEKSRATSPTSVVFP